MKTYIQPYMKQSLEGHVLEQTLDTEKYKAFYLKRPGEGRMMSTLIMFTPEGIVIMGDLCPSDRGAVSAFGYGLGWFYGILGEDYLCGKFLRKVWQKDAANEELKAYVVDEELNAKKWPNDKHYSDRPWKRVFDRWEAGGYETEEHLHEIMRAEGAYDGETFPGYDYPESAAGWLCAIQKRFAELMSESMKVSQ